MPAQPTILYSTGRDVLDHLGVDELIRSGRSVAILSASPVVRDLVLRRKGKRLPIVRTHRVLAVLIQATGLERHPPCDRCSCAKGPWKECVAILSPEGAQVTRGACANCLWNNQGSLCSFNHSPAKQSNSSVESSRQSPASLFTSLLPPARREPVVSGCLTAGIRIRTPEIAGIQPPELISVYIDMKKRLEQARSSMARLMTRSQVLDQHLSEIARLLSLPGPTEPQVPHDVDTNRVESGPLPSCTSTGPSSDITVEAGGDVLNTMAVAEGEPGQAEAVGEVL